MEIQTGFADVVVAAGTENISQLPYYVKDARWGARMGHKVFEDGVIDILTWPLDGNHNGVTAENVASKYNVQQRGSRISLHSSRIKEHAQQSKPENSKTNPACRIKRPQRKHYGL